MNERRNKEMKLRSGEPIGRSRLISGVGRTVMCADDPEAGGTMDKKVEGPRGTNQLVRSRQVEWRPLEEPGVSGVHVKVLRVDGATGRAPTILLRFEPGATYPPHNHPGGEEIFVLEGEVRLGKDHLRAGDYLYTAPNNRHGVSSETGCVLLLVVPEEVEILTRSDKTQAIREGA